MLLVLLLGACDRKPRTDADCADWYDNCTCSWQCTPRWDEPEFTCRTFCEDFDEEPPGDCLLVDPEAAACGFEVVGLE